MSESVTSLRLKIDSTDVKNAEKDLNSLSKASGSAEKSATNLTKSFTVMGSAISAVAAIALAKQFIDSADSLNKLDGRLKLATQSTKEYIEQQQALLKIAKETHTAVQDVTDLYVKIESPLKRLGANTEAVNQVVSNFTKGLKLGGASTEETASAIRQFAQAMGRGVLSGDEFTAMVEASPKMLEYMREGLGVTSAELLKMKENGELTAGRVSAALLKMTQKMGDDFKTLPKTVGDSVVDFNTELDKAIQRLDKTTGATAILSGAITEMATVISNKNGEMDKLVNTTTHLGEAVGILALVYGTYITVQKASLGYLALSTTTTIAYNIATNLSTTTVTRLTVAQVAATVATRAWTAALNLNPLVLGATVIAAGIYGVVQAMDAFSDAQDRNAKNSKSYADKQEKYFKSFRYTIDEIKKPLSELEKQEKGYLSGVEAARKSGNKSAEKVYQDNVNRIQKEKKVYLDAIKEQENAANKKAGIKKVGKTQAEIIADLEKDAPAAKVKKEKKAGKTEAEKLEEDIAKAKKDAMEDTADREAQLALDLYKSKEDAIQDSYDRQAQLAIDLYQTELYAIENNANRKSELALAFYEMTRSEQDKINEANLALYEANVGLFNDEQMQTFFTKWQESIEGVKGGYNDVQNIVSSFVEDSLNSKDWTAGLTGTAKSVANLGNAFKDLDKQNKKYETARSKIAKSNLNDEEKSIANKEIENTQYYAQIDAYGALAGAAAGFFEQGSTMAKAMAVVQGGLAIVSAGAGGDPYTVIPRMIAAAAMVAQTLSASGISGGGAATAPSQFEAARADIENTYAPMTDRLDRQIELLESIDKNGSASALGVGLAGTTFQRDYALWVEDTLEKARLVADTAISAAETTRIVSEAERISGIDIYSSSGGSVSLNTASLRESYNLIDALIGTLELGWGTFGQADSILGVEGVPREIASVKNSLNEVQNLISDWAMGVVSSMDDLKDASADFKSYFDDITGSMFYETDRLNKAFSDVGMLKGKNSFADYLQTNINEIDALQKFFTDETFGLLMSDNLNDIQKQIKAIDELSAVTGRTFEGGAKEALNYLESIQLVSEAMATSRENIDSFIGSLRTSQESAEYLAQTMGVSLATNVDELSELFNRLAYDTEGLTDKDLELLNVNKDLLENTDAMKKSQDDYNKTLQDTTKSISTLEGALSTITSTIEKLRSASRTSEQNLQVFYDAMAEAQRLSGTEDYTAYAEAVRKAADTSSALLNKDNFKLSRDMEFAQLVAAQQFEDLGATTLTQVDYLKQIEINTRTQIDVLVAAMDALGSSINSALKGKISSAMSSAALDTSITTSYQDILGREPDTGGASFWSSALTAGTLTKSTMDDAIATAAIPEIYQTLLGRAPDAEGLAYWSNVLATGQLAPDQIDDAIKAAAVANGELPSFDVGTTRVIKDMNARIHKDEIITPAPFSDGLRNGTLMMGNQTALVNELQKNNSLLSGIITKQDQQIQVLLESRDIQNGSLVELENIGVII